MRKILDKYEEYGFDLPYPITLKNSAEEILDDTTGERIGIRIPNLEGLARAYSVVRCLYPVRLHGREVRFIRRTLALTQKALAKSMDIAPEVISRWETDAKGVGGTTEKLFRSFVIITLADAAPGVVADRGALFRMKFSGDQDETKSIRFEAELTRVRKDNQQTSLEWDLPLAA